MEYQRRYKGEYWEIRIWLKYLQVLHQYTNQNTDIMWNTPRFPQGLYFSCHQNRWLSIDWKITFRSSASELSSAISPTKYHHGLSNNDLKWPKLATLSVHKMEVESMWHKDYLVLTTWALDRYIPELPLHHWRRSAARYHVVSFNAINFWRLVFMRTLQRGRHRGVWDDSEKVKIS